MNRHLLASMILAAIAAFAPAQVIMNSVETFDTSAPGGALWGQGDPDPLLGWQLAYINHDPTAVNITPVWFGTDSQHNYGTSVGQPYPGSVVGNGQGILLMQHDNCWGNSTDPSTGLPHNPSSNYIVYISFASSPARIYQVQGYVNTIQNVVEPPDPPGRDGIHPIVVTDDQAGFPDIRLGLKNGLFDPATDFTADWPKVTVTEEKTWVQTEPVQALSTGNVMTIILQVTNPDTKCGAGIMTDTSWDGIEILDLGPVCNVPFADADSDGDVDQEDFAVLQACIGIPAINDTCACFDHDQNGDHNGSIGPEDVMAFINCATGPGVLHADSPNPNCTNP